VAAAAEASADPLKSKRAARPGNFGARAAAQRYSQPRAYEDFFAQGGPHPGVFLQEEPGSYSRDRYSYGGLDLRAPSVEPHEIAGWLDFLTSGFNPDKAPGKTAAAPFRMKFPSKIPPHEGEGSAIFPVPNSLGPQDARSVLTAAATLPPLAANMKGGSGHGSGWR